jgi:drebrin-like protein
LEKVAPAYKPTRVNLAELTSQKEPSRYTQPQPQSSNGSGDVVRGEYQPIGKVDIAAIRRQAQASGSAADDRPTTVKGAYEPVGKVDIAAIRARAQNAPSPPSVSPAVTGDDDGRPKSLADRSAAFTQSERLTSLPKPKVASKFGGAGAFTGTKAPTPGGFGGTAPSAAPVGTASRTFADEGGKTPAQIWAEKKSRQGGSGGGAAAMQPIGAQQSGGSSGGGWRSGYAGKTWGPVQTTHTGKSATSNLSEQRTGQEQEEPTSPVGGVGAIRDRFAAAPPPLDQSSKPTGGRGIQIPGLPTRPSADQVPAEHYVDIPSPPPQPRSPTPPESPDFRPSSPIRVAMPVSRTKEPEELEPPEERFTRAPLPTSSLGHAASEARNAPDEDEHHGRGASQAAAVSTFGAGAADAQANTGEKRALIQYDYEKAEDNELELHEGGYVTNIEMVDEDWWHGENEHGETGLFPSNYVELVEDEEPATPAQPARAQAAAPAAAPAAPKGHTATAQYDYEAAEDNELSFPEGATIENVVSFEISPVLFIES